MIKLMGTAFAATALMLAPLSLVGSADAAAADPPSLHAKTYRNCDALLRDWPRGVAKNAQAAQRQVRQGNQRPASGPNARRTYNKNDGPLDRDNDGTACEQS